MATWYVNSDTGNDSTGNGSSGSPWKTLSKAVSASNGNDTIQLQAAVATYDLVTWSGRNVVGASPATCVLDGGGATKDIEFIGTVSTISNVTIQNINHTSTGTAIFNNGGSTDATLSFTNVIFKSITFDGDYSQGKAGMFSDSPNLGKINVNLASCVFNDVYPRTGWTHPAILSTGRGGVHTVTNCVFYCRTAGGNLLQAICGTASAGGGQTVVFKNCIFYNNTGSAIKISDTTWGTTVLTGSVYNCLYAASGSWTNQGALSGATGNVTSDPLFIDSVNANFRLRPTSPCINAGTLN